MAVATNFFHLDREKFISLSWNVSHAQRCQMLAGPLGSLFKDLLHPLAFQLSAHGKVDEVDYAMSTSKLIA